MSTTINSEKEEFLQLLKTSKVYSIWSPEQKAEITSGIINCPLEQLPILKQKLMEYEETYLQNQQELEIIDAELKKRESKEKFLQEEKQEKVNAEQLAQDLLKQLENC